MKDKTPAALINVECNFCGKGRKEVEKLVVSNDVGICNECIDLCSGILNKEKLEKMHDDKKINRALDPAKIKRHLDQYIIGQDEAKVALSVGVVNHYKRIFFESDVRVDKSNLLIFGPTGSGKTLLARTIADYLNVPFVIADATCLTEAGYVGDDAEEVVGRLLAAADYDIERCQQGIIFIDEVDKIGRKSESATVTRDVSGEGVQQALLKLVEGALCRVTIAANRKIVTSDTVEVDTRNILFIAAGAFEGINRIIGQRQNAVSIGFESNVDRRRVDRSRVSHEDFVKFGMIPEFTGRFPVIVHTNDLTLDDYVSILRDPKDSLVRQMQFLFGLDGIELEFEPDALTAIADRAHRLTVGARGLRSIVEKILMPYMFQLIELKNSGVKSLVITRDTVTQGAPAHLRQDPDPPSEQIQQILY
jgi:ATP-dependent Clp protease ATP-binding subunit ClpX